MTFFPLDWHTPTHLCGSFLLTHLLMWWRGVLVSRPYLGAGGQHHILRARIPTRQVKVAAAMITMVLGMAWEVFDQLFAGQFIFDPRGGDWADLAADAAGILLRLIL
jgi:hypothetical protein